MLSQETPGHTPFHGITLQFSVRFYQKWIPRHERAVVMETVLSEQDTQTNGHAEWRDMSGAIMRLSNIASLDDLLHQALNSWLQKLAPVLRW